MPPNNLRTACLHVLVLAALLACLPRQAHAQVRRCTTADGISIYTDRKCADLGASDRLPRASPNGGPGSLRLYRGGCSRNLQDLVYEMTTAIDAGDVNRLAGLYHWAGVSDRSAASLMNRLDAIARRPLVDIVPVAARSPAEDDEAYYPTTVPQRRPPVALRVEQTLGNGSTPSRTVFGLQRHFNCWWLRL